MNEDVTADGPRLEIDRTERQMRVVRWVLAGFAVAQFTLYQPPEGMTLPFDRLTMAVAVTAAIIVVNLASIAGERVGSVEQRRWLGWAQLIADVAITMWVIVLFTFDTGSALWALLVLPVLEGAIRAELRGAMLAWGLCTVGYAARELIAGFATHQKVFEIESVTYRMGIVLVIAVATGSLARDLANRVLDHSRALEESEHRAELLRILAGSSRNISSLDTPSVLSAVVDAGTSMGFDGASIAMLDPAAGTFSQPVHRGLPPEVVDIARPITTGVVAEVVGRGETVVVDHYDDWIGAPSDIRALGFRAVVATPIRESDETVGVLIVGRRGEGLVTEAERECLELLAAHAGAALTTARHFSERRALEARLEYEAFHDALTGLPNRTLFLDRLGHCLDRKRSTSSPTAVLFIDLDRFKKVNDSLGHEAGDDVLRQVTRRLDHRCGVGDTVARYGGDEFAILLEDPADLNAVIDTAGGIVSDLRRPSLVGDREVFVSASVGVSYRYEPGGEAEDFLREADLAMYRAKELGGGRLELYQPAMSTRAKQRLDMEHQLRGALDRDEFLVHYQPAIALEDGAVAGLEALVRWQHPERGLLPASEFIPLAEHTGLVVPIGQHVLEEVSRQIRRWDTTLPRFPIGVNVSATELLQPNFVDQVTGVLSAHGVDPAAVIFEVTESDVMRDDVAALDRVNELSRIGVRLSIDDFGLGYSSLSYLSRYPFAVLKIDRSFIADVATRKTDQAIVRYVLGLARDLEIPVVAEGVESEGQLAFLQKAGCRFVQGYHVCEPMDAAGIERFVNHRAPV